MIKFTRSIDTERAWESLKLFFAAVGGFGFCGYLASMKAWLAVPVLCGGIASWYLIYRQTEKI